MRTLYQNITEIDFDLNKTNIILQSCNNIGKYGAGISGAISNKWPVVEEQYKLWHQADGSKPRGCSGPFRLGEIQAVRVDEHVIVINLIAQHGVRSRSNVKPFSINYLIKCLDTVIRVILHDDSRLRIYCPKIGSGLGGGTWNEILPVIKHQLGRFDLVIVEF